ncbi:MAG: phospholipase A-2-activating protein [Bacillariaceae sp.]|jgi:phospholipase A-2-activating protein
MEIDWELSGQFVSDSQGIRVACVLPPLGGDSSDDNYRIVTGNQGGGLCEFSIPSGSLKPIEYQHNHAISALLSSSSSSSSSDNGFYVTGCKDNLVRVFDSTSHELKATLKGHEKPVTSMAFVRAGADASTNDYLVTGSWDGTAKIWDVHRQAMLATLPGHENSTCVTGLVPTKDQPANIIKIATGSAGIAQNNQIQGYTVRIWTVDIQTGQVQCEHTVANDHEGPIRDISTLGGGGQQQQNTPIIATCSNDGSVRLRSSDTGESLSTLTFLQQQSSHPPMLLSVAPVLEDSAAADSDNNNAVVTNIISSAEDGNVVAWGYQDDSVTEPQIIMHPSCVWKVIGLPKGDFATCCQDGTLRIFTKASDRMVPQAEKEAFDHAVQEATAKKQSGPSAEEVAKLPLWENNLQKRGTSEGQVQLFNKNNNAIAAQWSASSQTWIEVGQVMGSADGGTIDGAQYDHVLPIEVDQADGGVAKLQIGYNNGENQFVAAQRFIDAHMLPQNHLNDIANYIQQRVGNQTPTLGMEGGATTAAASPTPVATTGMPMIGYKHIPVPAYKSFELPVKSATTTLEKMKKKIEEYGHLSDSQLATLTNLMTTLGATNRYHSSKIEQDELKMISDMLGSFPRNEVFPALDLARLTVAHPDGAHSSNVTYWNTMICKALSMCADTTDLDGPAAVAIPMLSLRLFANAFRGGPGSLQAITSQLEPILRCNGKFITSKNKNIRLSVATLLYNLSFYVHSNKDDASAAIIASQVVLQVDTVLKSKMYETEALIRSMVALGTVVTASPEAKETAKSAYIVSRVEMSASSHGDLAKSIAKEVYNAIA